MGAMRASAARPPAGHERRQLQGDHGRTQSPWRGDAASAHQDDRIYAGDAGIREHMALEGRGARFVLRLPVQTKGEDLPVDDELEQRQEGVCGEKHVKQAFRARHVTVSHLGGDDGEQRRKPEGVDHSRRAGPVGQNDECLDRSEGQKQSKRPSVAALDRRQHGRWIATHEQRQGKRHDGQIRRGMDLGRR